MKRHQKFLLIFITGIIMFLIFWYIHLSTRANEVPSNSEAPEIIVKYNAGYKNGWVAKTKKMMFEEKNDLYFKEKINEDLALYQTDGRKDIEAELSSLKKESAVADVQINYHYKAMSEVNDTDFGKLWALKNTGQTINGVSGTEGSDLSAPLAWNLEKDNWSETKIAVIDAGFSANYDDIRDNIDLFHSFDFTTNDFLNIDTVDSAGSHGAQIAAIIASISNNNSALSGLSSINKLKLMLLKTDFTTAKLINAISYAGENGAKVINASWGCLDDGGLSDYSCGNSKDYNDAALEQAISDFPGIVVTAAGNIGQEEGSPSNNHDSGGHHVYPCDFDLNNIICTAATDQNDQLANFSDFGVNSVDVAAPGTNIYVPNSASETTLFNEDFNAVVPPAIGSHLTKEGTDNNWGTVDMSDMNALSTDYQNMPYLSNQSTSVKTDTINMSPEMYSSGKAKFNISCDTEPRDPGWTDYVVLSVYNGTSWQEIDRFDETKLGDELFHPIESDLTPYLNSQLEIKFTWITNAVNNGHFGCDIWPITITGDQTSGYTYANGTSYSAAYVSGLAGLLWSADQNLSTDQIKQTVISSGDEKASLIGKTVSGRRVNYFSALKSLDVTAPTGTLTANINNGTTTTPALLLNLDASDTGFGFASVRFSNNGNVWSDWTNTQTNFPWDVTNSLYGGNPNFGNKIIYFQMKDVVDNVSATFDYSLVYQAADITAPITAPITTPVTAPELSLSPSNFSTGWNMVSFPDLTTITNEALGLIITNGFKLRGYDGGGNSYVKGDDVNISLTPGAGYWLKVDDTNKIAGLKYPLNQTATTEVVVTKGWNLLGNPFQSDLPLANLVIKYKDGSTLSYAEAIANKDVSGYAWSWEASSKEYLFIAINPDKYKTSATKKSVIAPFRGFWMIINSDQVSGIIMNK